MSELIPPLAYLLMRRQDAIHCPFRAEVSALVEQGRVDLGRWQIHKSRLVEHHEDGRALRLVECAEGNSPARRGTLGPPPSIVGRPWHPERRARRCHAEPRP